MGQKCCVCLVRHDRVNPALKEAQNGGKPSYAQGDSIELHEQHDHEYHNGHLTVETPQDPRPPDEPSQSTPVEPSQPSPIVEPPQLPPVLAQSTAPSEADSSPGHLNFLAPEDHVTEPTPSNATVQSTTSVVDKSGKWKELTFLTEVECEPGDCVLIRPTNSAASIEEICKVLHIADDTLDRPFMIDVGEETSFRITLPTTLRRVFTEEIDLSLSPSRSLLRAVGALYSLADDLTTDRRAYKMWVTERAPTLAEFLRLMPLVQNQDESNHPLVEMLLREAPLIEPRSYLVASVTKGSISICFNEQQHIGSTERAGLATQYLKALKTDDKLTITVTHLGFVFPESKTAPIIFVASTFGIAMVKAMLEKFDAEKDRKNPVYLFWEVDDRESTPYYDWILARKKAGRFKETFSAPRIAEDAPDGVSLCLAITSNSSRMKTLKKLFEKEETKIFVCGSIAFCANAQVVLPAIVPPKTAASLMGRISVQYTDEQVADDVEADVMASSVENTVDDGQVAGQTSEEVDGGPVANGKSAKRTKGHRNGHVTSTPMKNGKSASRKTKGEKVEKNGASVMAEDAPGKDGKKKKLKGIFGKKQSKKQKAP